MQTPYSGDDQDLDELLRQVDDLLDDSKTAFPAGMFDDTDDDEDDLDEYVPEDLEQDDPVVFQNFSNHYGADVQNYANGYGGRQAPPAPQPEPAAPVIPAYNPDFKTPRREKAPRQERPRPEQPRRREAASEPAYRPAYREPAPEVPEYPEPAPRRKQKAPRKRRGCGCGCSTVLVLLALIIGGAVGWVHFFFRPPVSDVSIGDRKSDTASILLCGVDEDGTRTDTMMLLYLSGSEHKVGLLSLPRDTYTIASAGYGAKLNSAYGRNNCGEEGMEGLFDYIQEIIGYRPDGYVLVDFNLVPKLADLLGGLEFEVPDSLDEAVDGLKGGLQHLNGDQVLTMLRHRASYPTADLGRVEIQREVIRAAMEQWLSPKNLVHAFSALDLVENDSLSSLSAGNYFWMAKTILLNLKNITMDTLPGYATMIDGSSYYVLCPDEVADLVDGSYNPYQVPITVDRLNIAEE